MRKRKPLETWMLIIRATTMHGPEQRAAIDEIHRRFAWLSREQQVAAGFATQADYDRDYRDWWDCHVNAIPRGE